MSVGSLLYDVLVKAIYDESATFFDLLKGVLVIAATIFVSFELLKPPLTWLVKGPMSNIMWKITEVEFNRADMIERQEHNKVTTKQEYFDKMVVEMTPLGWLVTLQHTIGGLCAAPAVFGVGDFSASERSSLACLGLMIEMGWELQEFAIIFYTRAFKGEEGKEKYPNIAILFALIHHGLACSMGLPVILAYRHSSLIHHMIFDLQGAAGLALLFVETTRTLDVKKKNELRMFVFVSFIMLLVMIWTRFFHWFYLVYKILAMFIADKKWSFVFFGSIIFAIFSVFNVMFCVIGMFKRYAKFIKKLKEFDSLPADADESKKRAASAELELAAGDLAMLEFRFEEALMSIFMDQKVVRRHTFNSASLSRAAAKVAAAEGDSRQSMVAWRNMPSRVEARVNKKTD